MIIVADHNRPTSEMLARKLNAESLPATAFSDPSAMGQAVRELRATALIADAALLGARFEGVRWVRSISPGIPILVLTSVDGPGDREAATRSGADALFLKGRLSPNELVLRLRALLAARGGAQAEDRGVARPDLATGVYALRVDPHSADASRLATDLDVEPGLRCRRCSRALGLQLRRDTKRWGRWMMAAVTCVECVKTQAKLTAKTAAQLNVASSVAQARA